jgi:hypothetical protein
MPITIPQTQGAQQTGQQADVAYWRKRWEATERERDALRAALMYHVECEDWPCRIVNSYCEDHASFVERGGECMVSQHRRLLGLEVE